MRIYIVLVFGGKKQINERNIIIREHVFSALMGRNFAILKKFNK